MASGQIRLDGLKETVLALRELPMEIGGKNGGPLRGALFAATKIIRDGARANAPRGEETPMPGNLKRQIYAYRDRNPRGSTGAAERYIISVRKGRRGSRSRKHEQFGQPAARSSVNVVAGDAYYWFFVEFGTVKQGAQSFMRRAFEENKESAVLRFTTELRRGVTQAVQRLQNKHRTRRRR